MAFVVSPACLRRCGKDCLDEAFLLSFVARGCFPRVCSRQDPARSGLVWFGGEEGARGLQPHPPARVVLRAEQETRRASSELGALTVRAQAFECSDFADEMSGRGITNACSFSSISPCSFKTLQG